MWHKKTSVFPRLFLTFIILILSLLTLTVFGSASYEETSGVPNTEETTSPDNETNDNNNENLPVIKQGLIEENGKIYFYNEDGTLFKAGYKEVKDADNNIKYYYEKK